MIAERMAVMPFFFARRTSALRRAFGATPKICSAFG
jgi:hypothetical protein